MDSPRWHFRFDNFQATLTSLDATIDLMGMRALSELEQAGTVQQFETCWEAGWKTLRDYLFASGLPVAIPAPINVIRAAFQANLIADGDMWVRAMKARNTMSHEYDPELFSKIVADIKADYVPLLRALKVVLKNERDAGN